MKPWIGSEFAKQEKHVLILGESWYGDSRPSDEVRYIESWIERMPPGRSDRFFSRIYNACNRKSAADSTVTERCAFWATVAFTNLVSESVGGAARIRPTNAHWARGVRRLRLMLPRLKCDRVLMLGCDTTFYAKPLIEKHGIAAVSCPHPSGYGVTKATLRDKWLEVIK